MTALTVIPESGSAFAAVEGAPSGEVVGDFVRQGKLVLSSESETGWTPADGETSFMRKARIAPPLIRLPSGTLPRKRTRILQQWEGIVTDVGVDSFFADLQDLADSDLPIEVVELPIDEVSPDDRSLLVEGSVFYWSIGHETSPGGQLRRISEIRFRRTPRWTRRAVREAEKQAEELFELHGR